MSGLKNVRQRRNDALSRIGWDELERVLAAYYRDVGWWVEHAGTGGTGAKTDGGVDLRLRRNDEIVLVQCKHWNAKQVPHNAVHELLGVMVNEGATGAILISSGEFTHAAIEAAQRHGKVKLIDGDALRAMLGTLPETAEPGDPFAAASASTPGPRVRVRARARPRAAQGRPWMWLIALVAAIGFVLIVRAMLARTADTAVAPPPDPPRAATPTIVIHAPVPVAAPSPPPPPRAPTEAEIRESQRKADDAMTLIEDSTPEM
jgi:restriction system protein